MAIVLEANYSKKIGLAGFSSHQFSLTLKKEISDSTKVQEESEQLYSLLQQSVDHSIQHIGYLPDQQGTKNGNGNGNGHPKPPQRNNTPIHDWKCTIAQKELIQRVVDENKLDKDEIEQLAQKRFRKGVKALNKLEASGFITELLDQYPGKNQPRSR